MALTRSLKLYYGLGQAAQGIPGGGASFVRLVQQGAVQVKGEQADHGCTSSVKALQMRQLPSRSQAA